MSLHQVQFAFHLEDLPLKEDVDYTLNLINHAVDRLRELSPLWEMYLDGIDLDTVDWQTH